MTWNDIAQYIINMSLKERKRNAIMYAKGEHNSLMVAFPSIRNFGTNEPVIQLDITKQQKDPEDYLF